MYGSKPGYDSTKFWRKPRCTEDLTLDFVLGAILSLHSVLAIGHTSLVLLIKLGTLRDCSAKLGYRCN